MPIVGHSFRMQINVAQLLIEPIGSTRTWDINQPTSDGEQVWGRVTLTRTDRGILVTGKLHTAVTVTCSRCLGPARQELLLNIEEEYFPTVDVATGVPLSPAGESGTFTIDEQHTLDIEEAVRQYTVVAIPMKALCREDCPGLCPQCGQNLNEGPCGCAEPELDARWAPLRKLNLS